MFEQLHWAATDLGTPISMYSSHDFNSLKTPAEALHPLLLIGGVHGDEPLGVRLAEETLAFLKSDAKKSHSEVKLPWALIPILNVDGYRAGTRVNGRGVDLNRNYPSRSWNPVAEKERYNPGPAPASEKEIQALVQWIEQIKPRMIIHFHSWKPCVVAAGPRALRDAERLGRSSGYEVVSEIGYPTPGSLSQYGWFDQQIPIICIEEDDNASPDAVWPHFGPGLKEIFLDASIR